ncbi:mitochondrial carrier domain-containing protein [Cyathus striatus]|nr:mitochondrial carrier domain-containing protein [Cyathus striatus]
MQLATGKNQDGLVGTLQKIIKEEGAGRLYRGPAANDFWGKTFLDMAGESKMTQNLSIVTGCAAGATESFVVVPFELVKIKLQDKSSTFKGPMDVVKQVIRKEGMLGLYAGMESTFWRHVYWNGGYFGCIHQVRQLLPKAETPQAQLMNNFISGAIGGFAGTVVNTPYVVKSRIQGYTPFPASAALYKGFVPKVLRLAPGGGVLLLVVSLHWACLERVSLGPPYI